MEAGGSEPWGLRGRASCFVWSGAAVGALRLTDGAFSMGWLPGLVDAFQCVAMGGVLAAMCLVGAWLPSRLRWPAVALLLAGSAGWLLADDVDNFSRRQVWVSQWLAYWATAILLAQGVLVALLSARWLLHLRASWVGGLLSAVMLAANRIALPGDYQGVHWLLGMMALVWGGVPFEARRLGERPLFRKLSFALPLVAAFGAYGLAGRPEVASALAGQTSACFAPFFPQLSTRAQDKNDVARDPLDSPWLMKRAALPSIAPSADNPLSENPIVIVLSVDALRADVVNNREHAKQLPHLTRLRDEGLVFLEARAPGTLTKNSLSSLFLGTYFSQQYWSGMKNRNGALAVHRDDTTRFVELLGDAKVKTVNFRPISWIRNGVMLRGMQEDVQIKYPKKKSYYAPSPPVFKKLLPRVKAMVQAPKQPVFLFTHLADPHAPYDQGRRKKGSAFRRYLSEVELVDRHVGKLLALLETKGLAERVLLVLTADHGEAFGEHGAKTHGTNLYDEALRIPLIFWRPGIKAQERKELVSLIDLGPTVLDAFALPTPSFMMGQSLLPFLAGREPQLSRPILAETRLKRALVTPEQMKLIVDVRKKRIELYDLKVDPGEKTNLAADKARLKEPKAYMDRFFEVHQLRTAGGKPYTPPYVR